MSHMIFNLERPIADQLIESILDYPEEWEIVLVSGNPIKHVHKNGVEIWVAKNQPCLVELWKPDTIKLIELTDEDKRRIYKAVIQIREETDARRLADAKNTLVQLMNKEVSEKKHIIDIFFDFSIENGRAIRLIGLSMILLALILTHIQ